MSSDFDTFAEEFAAPCLVEQFGERDANGALVEVTYHPPGNKPPIELMGVIVGALSVEAVEAEQGNFVRRETVTVRVPKAQNPKLTELQQKSRFTIPTLGNRQFVPQQAGSASRAAFFDYALERKPLANMDERTGNASTV